MHTERELANQAGNDRRKRMTRAEREEQILAVAEEVFATRGYRASSMDDIALRVGLSKPMLYEYFGSKDGLLVACIKQAKQDLLRATSAAAERAGSSRELMRECLLAFFRFSDEHAQAWALLRNEAAIPGSSVNSELESIRRQQTEFTADLLRATHPEADQVQLEAFAEALIGACERLVTWRERRPEISADDATEHLMALLTPSLTSGE